jgi:hypothetical protein
MAETPEASNPQTIIATIHILETDFLVSATLRPEAVRLHIVIVASFILPVATMAQAGSTTTPSTPLVSPTKIGTINIQSAINRHCRYAEKNTAITVFPRR